MPALPGVLLGIRCIPNNTGFSPFTSVTGTTMLCPSLPPADTSISTSHEFITKLARQMQQIDFANLSHYTPHHQSSNSTSYVPTALSSATHVWVRVDRVRKPLEAPYTGPFPVEHRNEKYFTIKKPDGSFTNISIDRLKPAVLPSSTPVIKPTTPDLNDNIINNNPESTTTASTRTTRSGRHVHFPKHLEKYHCF